MSIRRAVPAATVSHFLNNNNTSCRPTTHPSYSWVYEKVVQFAVCVADRWCVPCSICAMWKVVLARGTILLLETIRIRVRDGCLKDTHHCLPWKNVLQYLNSSYIGNPRISSLCHPLQWPYWTYAERIQTVCTERGEAGGRVVVMSSCDRTDWSLDGTSLHSIHGFTIYIAPYRGSSGERPCTDRTHRSHSS